MENLLTQTTGRKRQWNASKRKEFIFLFCMLVLPVCQWLVYFVYLNANSFVLAFSQKRTGLFPVFDNFEKVWESLTTDKGELAISLINTLKYFFTDFLIIMPLCLFSAYFFYKKIAGYKVYRVLCYLPSIISSMVMVETFKSFVDPRGPLSGLLEMIFHYTIAPEGLFNHPDTATNTILIYCIWTGFGTKMLYFGGAMARIPLEVLESAKLEGCGPFRELFQLIFPLIWATTSTQIILLFTSLVSSGGSILLFTGGASQTSTLSYWIFAKLYSPGMGGVAGNYELVSCMGLCFTLVMVPLILFIRWLMDRFPAVEY